MLAVVDDAGVARRRAGLEEHQTEPRPLDPADMARVNAMSARLAIDNTAELSFREARHPGAPAAEPRQDTADIQLAAADAGLEQMGLLQALQPGRRQAQQRLAAGQQIVPRHGSGELGHSLAAGAAGDVDDLPGDEGRTIAAQAGDKVRDLPR